MFSILYEDDSLLVVNKPSGMLVIPAKEEKRLSLYELLNKKLIQENKPYRVHPCHRIDRDASGIVIFAKGKQNQSIIMKQFQTQQVKKKYIAFVKGELAKKENTLIDYVQAIEKKNPKKSILYYRVLEEKKSWSALEVRTLTGRMHQIRLQFAKIGHPLLGERLYAFGRDFDVKFRRLALHAQNISLIHPQTKSIISFAAPLPADMKNFLNSGEKNQ